LSGIGKIKLSGVFEGFTVSKSSASPEVKGTPVTDFIEAEQERAPKAIDN